MPTKSQKDIQFEEFYGPRYRTREFEDQNPQNVDFSQQRYDDRKRRFLGAVELSKAAGVVEGVEAAISEFQAYGMGEPYLAKILHNEKTGDSKYWLIFPEAKVNDPEQKDLKEERLVAFDKMNAMQLIEIPAIAIYHYQTTSIQEGRPVQNIHPNLGPQWIALNQQLIRERNVKAAQDDNLLDKAFEGVGL